MQIQDMSIDASIALLKRACVGHIACSQESQPYVTPFSFGYDGTYIYSFATVGRKIDMLRANPLVCVGAEEVVDLNRWKSVIVFGRFEELPNTPECSDAVTMAHFMLSRRAEWWHPGYVKTLHNGLERKLDFVWFRILIHKITGHEAIPDIDMTERKSAVSTFMHALTQWLPGKQAEG
jgi:nitroimidazol reductase NimA-like FMN-containing flavoprotein (pyridoxamine 5'-phosphate oxidase superfamily)